MTRKTFAFVFHHSFKRIEIKRAVFTRPTKLGLSCNYTRNLSATIQFGNSLIHILSLSNWHNNIASMQRNLGDKSHRFFCIDVTLLCEFESDKMRINQFE